MLPPGEFGQERGDGTPSRFLNACCFRCQHYPVPHPLSWSELETPRLGAGLPSPFQYDRPGNFPIFREDFQFKRYLQRFRYTNDMEKLAEGRIVARNQPLAPALLHYLDFYLWQPRLPHNLRE